MTAPLSPLESRALAGLQCLLVVENWVSHVSWFCRSTRNTILGKACWAELSNLKGTPMITQPTAVKASMPNADASSQWPLPIDLVKLSPETLGAWAWDFTELSLFRNKDWFLTSILPVANYTSSSAWVIPWCTKWNIWEENGPPCIS